MQNIILESLYKNALEMSFTADDLFQNHILNQKDEKIIIDFKNIEFISLSFAQEYVYNKKNTNKEIIEINMNEEIYPMLQLVENRKH